VTVAAGVDIGNSTTEVVLGRVRRDGIEVIDVARAPTRRAKGSSESIDGATALLRRLERRHEVHVEVACAARLRPVETRTATLPEPETNTGRLSVVTAGAGTAGGRGSGVGRPHRLGDPPPDGVVVAVVPAGTGYASAAEQLARLIADGRLAAVVLEDDEAVLVANRLPVPVPVVDEVDAQAVLAAELLAAEVAPPGTPLRMLTDPLQLVESLRLGDAERADAARLAAMLYDASNAVVAVRLAAAKGPRAPSGWVDVGTARLPFPEAHQAVRDGLVGSASCYSLPPDDTAQRVDDLWTVDLSAVSEAVMTRAGGARSRAIGIAALRADAPYVDPGPALSDRIGVRVEVEDSEARAAWAGAMTTPGAAADDETQRTVVIDLGGGTLDTVSSAAAVVAAGGGELLTRSVAALAGSSAAAAEWIKRGPAFRVEAPQVLLAEDGSREFLDRPAPADTIGALVVAGPAGLLPFSRTLAPGEWRALRLRLKVELVGGNIARALRSLAIKPSTVVVVGGPAGDDEVLSAVARALPDGVAVGRGNVGGSLEHRYAVAYGLLCRLSR
jgi:hypothetical protein